MIRILTIGRSAQYVQEKLAGYHVHVELAKLPAAGVRAMEETPPDLIIIHDLKASPTLWLLVQGIRARPLGKLTPIIVLAPPQDPDLSENNIENNVEGFDSPSISTPDLIHLLISILGLQASDLEKESADMPTPPLKKEHTKLAYENKNENERLIVQGQGYTLEEVYSPHVPAASNVPIEEELRAEHIRHMLRKVRHEDYFTILNVQRNANSNRVENAYRALSHRFEPTKVSFEISRSFRDELAEISDALEDAWAVLGDDALRQSYLESTTRL